MSKLSISESKYGFSISRKNKSNLKFEATNCMCVKQIEKNDSIWFIKIKVPNDIAVVIREIECEANSKIVNYNLLSSIDNDFCMNIKIPYRYKKFECDFFDILENRIVSDEIQIDDTICIHIECNNIWKNEACCGLTWKTKLIKKM